MKIPVANNLNRGQTSLEYLLLLAVVAVIVIASFSKGSLVDQVHDSAQGYYNSVTRVIMGNGTDANPTPINGGWCPVATPASGSIGPKIVYRSCECPPPAFGGALCTDTANNPNPDPCLTTPGQTCNGAKVTFTNVTACGPCPTGQLCNASGQCACPNNFTCPANSNSSPDSTCTECQCWDGYTLDPTSKLCLINCPSPCTQWSDASQSCVPVKCGTNQWCNPALPAATECACVAGTYWDSSANYGVGGCVYCPNCQKYDTKSKKCVDASTSICAPAGNWTCNPDAPSNQICQCNAGYVPAVPPATGCFQCTPNCGCTTDANGVTTCTKQCGSDGCGGSCDYLCVGTCTNNDTTCACTPSCAANADCGDSDGCGGKCQGTCFASGTSCVAGACAPECGPQQVGTGTCQVTLQGGTHSGQSDPGESCPIGCIGGPVTSTCTNGSWGPITGVCQVACSTLTEGSGSCQVTFSGPVASGSPAVAGACSAGCTGSPTSTCINGIWGPPTGTCLASCSTTTVASGSCSATFTGPIASGASASGTCSTGCSGSVTSLCTNGAWGTASGKCYSDCTPAKTVTGSGNAACDVTFPAGTANSATPYSQTCPTGCTAGPSDVTITCSSGRWGSASTACKANTCSATALPSSETKCSSDNLLPATNGASYTLKQTCDSSIACEATCASGYTWSNGSCLKNCAKSSLSLNGTTATFLAMPEGPATGTCSTGGGSASATCGANGRWGTATGTCCAKGKTWNGSSCA